MNCEVQELRFYKSGNIYLRIGIPDDMNENKYAFKVSLYNSDEDVEVPLKSEVRVDNTDGIETASIASVILTRQVFFKSEKIEGNWSVRLLWGQDLIDLDYDIVEQKKKIGINNNLYKIHLSNGGLNIRQYKSSIFGLPYKIKQVIRWKKFRENYLNNVVLQENGESSLIYIPWIERTSDALIKAIDEKSNLTIFPFEVFRDSHNQKNRARIIKFSRNNKDLVKDYLINQFKQNIGRISGLIVTLDWTPPLRLVVEACKELGIPTILIPHESVFADEEMFYVEPITGVNTPICDVALTWGDLQKQILLSRGFNNKIINVGTPKFDVYKNYLPTEDRVNFYNRSGLNEEKHTILLALQPLDSQFDEREARDAQLALLTDLVKVCIVNDFQLIVRMPPALGEKVLNSKRRKQLSLFKEFIYIEGLNNTNTSKPMDAIYHTDLTISINSTMLFEAALLNKPSISAKYTEFTLFWDKVGIPIVHNFDELNETILKHIGSNSNSVTEQGWEWAKRMLSDGEFNFDASEKIARITKNILEQKI